MIVTFKKFLICLLEIKATLLNIVLWLHLLTKYLAMRGRMRTFS